jgi:hypothetical protein
MAIAELEDRFAAAYQAVEPTFSFSADSVTQVSYTFEGRASHYGSSVTDVIDRVELPREL